MTGLLTATASDDRRAKRRAQRPHRLGPRIGIGMAVAGGIVGLIILSGDAATAQGGDEPPPTKRRVSRSPFVAGIQRALKADDLRLIALAKQVAPQPPIPWKREDEHDRLRIDAMKAEGEYQYATLRREIAEMALKEYTEATLPHDLAAVESELSIAQAEVVQAREKAKEANGDIPKITGDLLQQKAAFGLELAQSKKDVLVKYTRSQRTKELESQLAKARSEETHRKAEWDLLKARIERKQDPAASEPRRTDGEKRILALLDRTIPIEDQIQARLLQLAGEPKPDDAVAKEIRSRLDELEALIDEAEAIKAADDFARWKPQIRRAARGSSPARSR